MKLDRVTLTGADDSVDPKDLLKLSRKYPFVEWGILIASMDGGSESGACRFPSTDWISRLGRLNGLRLSAHLCGTPVIAVLMAGELPFPKRGSIFQRVQLNFHGSKLPKFVPSKLPTADLQFMFQCDGVNDALVQEWVRRGLGSPLFDTSSGAGVLPNDGWPGCWKGVYCGYAGGLGPENVVEQVSGPIRKAVGDGHCWIDMETRVRSNHDAQFDLAKCEQVLKLVAGYITK